MPFDENPFRGRFLHAAMSIRRAMSRHGLQRAVGAFAEPSFAAGFRTRAVGGGLRPASMSHTVCGTRGLASVHPDMRAVAQVRYQRPRPSLRRAVLRTVRAAQCALCAACWQSSLPCCCVTPGCLWRSVRCAGMAGQLQAVE